MGCETARYNRGMGPFTAVTTTGIYCRPGCGARPRADHARHYLLAAAAEADGYRACLRCRPYRVLPAVPSAISELVCRGVRLILDGVLDEHSEFELGRRLGISARHLRRLFAEHIGVTPDALARSARVHFARRLLDDTDLTITQVAFAAGFGSLRTFNRAFHEVFRAPPGLLRAKRRTTDRLVADGGLVLRLTYEGPLDWEAMSAYFAARAIPGVECVDGQIYRRTVIVGGDPGVVELMPGDEGFILLRAHLPHWEELIHLVARARRIANLDLDVATPARRLAGDPIIGPLLRARPGIRPPGTWDPFEIGVRAIIGQQISVPAANAVAGALVARCGDPVPGLRPFGLTHTFPAPQVIATADLSGVGLTRSAAEAIRTFARAVTDRTLRLDQSDRLERLIDSLTAIPGIGPWTAHYIALRVGEVDAYPARDLGLRRALARLAGGRSMDLAGLDARWRPWRALAAAHLWMAPSEGGRPGLAQTGAA